MAGVFVGYNRVDQDLAERVVEGLRAHGVTVWWDRDIPLGANWAAEIGGQFEKLDALLAIWTQTRDTYLNIEAREAAQLNKLVNVVCGVPRPPFPHDALPFASLDGWTGDDQHPGWRALLALLGAMLPGGLPQATIEPVRDESIRAEPGRAEPVRAAPPRAQPPEPHPPQPQPASPLRVLLSYRRSDTDAAAGRIRDTLAAEFGEDAVFMDIDSIPIGADFREHIARAVRQATVVLAIIGPRWRGAIRNGARRIASANDPVRLEIEAALAAKVVLIPILISDTPMPDAETLPESIRDMTFRNGMSIDSGRDFHAHMERLMRAIERLSAPGQAAVG